MNWFIALPVWGAAYIETALRYTIPALLASAEAAGVERMRFLLHTSEPALLSEALAGHEVECAEIPDGPYQFARFAAAHREALDAAPEGANVCLLNADMPMSIESIGFAERSFVAGRKVIVSTGLRSLIAGTPPPIGATARDLLAWCWASRHPIAQDCIWGTGRGKPPTTLFFANGANVVLHCFHLHPIFLHKDRALSCKGTVDDDLLKRYEDNEIAYVTKGEMALAELSPPEKHFQAGALLTVPRVVLWAHGRVTAAHRRNFAQPITVMGNPALVDDSPARAILAMLDDMRNQRFQRPRVYVRRRRAAA